MKNVIDSLEQVIAQADPSACPELVGQLERLKFLAWMRGANAGKQANGVGEVQHLLTIQQVAERLNVPKTYAYELVRQGRLKGKKIGKYVRVSADALAQYQTKLPNGY